MITNRQLASFTESAVEAKAQTIAFVYFPDRLSEDGQLDQDLSLTTENLLIELESSHFVMGVEQFMHGVLLSSQKTPQELFEELSQSGFKSAIGISFLGGQVFCWDELSTEQIQKTLVLCVKHSERIGEFVMHTPEIEVAESILSDFELPDQFALNPNWSFQPIMSAEGGVFGAEMLISWRSIYGEMANTQKIITLLEKFQAISALDSLTLNDLLDIKEQLLKIKPSRLFINIGFESIENGRVETWVLENLEEGQFAGHQVVFELMEQSFVKFRPPQLKTLERIQKTGVVIALDDFGDVAGSITAFVKTPAEMLKLSRNVFVLSKTRSGFKLLSELIQTAHSFNKFLVIEGIENENEDQLAKSLEIDGMQGHYFYKPLSAEEFLDEFRREQ